MSVLIAATFGCVVTTLILVAFLYEPILVGGFVYPIVAVGLMIGTHFIVSKVKQGPDPTHMAIQQSVVIGGFLSVLLAYLVSKVISPTDLLYAALATSVLAFLSIALEQFGQAKLVNAAEKASRAAEEGKQLADYGELADAEDVLTEALLTTELGYGSYHPQVAKIVGYLADLMWLRKREAAATRMYERAVLVHNKLGADTPGMVQALQKYAEHLERTANLEKGITVAKKLVKRANKVHGRSAEQGKALLVLSEMQMAQEETSVAYETSKQAASMLEKSSGRSHPLTLRAKSLVASQCVMLGRLAEGERIIREVILEKDRNKSNQDEDYLGLLLDLLTIQEKNEDKTAHLTLQKAIEQLRANIGPDYERADEILSRLPAYITKGAPEINAKFLEALLENNGMVARDAISNHTDAILDYVDASGWTALQWAVFLDRTDLAERLISKGANHSFGADTDLPALYLASRWGRKRLISALCQKEADVNIATLDGSRPIHGAVRSGDQFTYDSLVSKGADLELTNKAGWTVLHEAAYAGDRKLLIQLITKGLDLELQAGNRRETPLHAAVIGGHASTIEALILNGADLDKTCSAGRTPLRIAEQMDRQDLVALLKSHAEPDEAAK